MRIVADENIPFVANAFGNIGTVITLPTPQITQQTARAADVLVIRNETLVSAELLRGTRVRFVASATAGRDHVDFDYLEAAGIPFENAPGSNANSVKEYVIAALLAFAARHRVSLQGKSLGIVGVGAIGSKVAKAAEVLGMKVVENDPPLARSTRDPRFLPLERVLGADFITLHTPLTEGGQDPTCHLFDSTRLAQMKPSAVLINSARGAVVHTDALKAALNNGQLAAALIDVWEDEPAIDACLLAQAAIGTAHVAGYSMEGKLRAVQMVRDAVASHFGISTTWDPAQHLGTPHGSKFTLNAHAVPRETTLHQLVKQVYDVEQDHALLRNMLSLAPEQRAAYYTGLRTRYPSRREFSSYTVELPPHNEHLRETVTGLGFKCDGQT
jgi:erythronate-4-phosphate dehydrogenase